MVRPHDALDDGETQPDARVITADARIPTLKWFSELRQLPGFEFVSTVFNNECGEARFDRRSDLYRATGGQIVDDGVV